MARSLYLNRDFSPQLKSLLDTADLPVEEGWKGTFKGQTHGGGPFDARLFMWLRIGTNVVDGRGKGINFPRPASELPPFAVSGTVFARVVQIQLHFDVSFLRSTAFLCDGELSLDRGRISGDFHLPCLTGCGRKTAALGNFELLRITEAG